LRIAVKRLRYTVELFAAEVGPDAETALLQLKAVQDALGEVHDHDVLIARLRTELRQVARRGQHAGPKHAAKNERRTWGLALALAHARDERQARYDVAVTTWTALADAGVLHDLSALGTKVGAGAESLAGAS
jgi:CHAD domain-containing protein